MEEISKDGQYAIGIDDTMYAVTSGILDTLILWDNLSTNRIELVKTLSPSDPPKILYLPQEKQIPENLKEEWKVKSNVPLLDWILEHYIEFGCKLELVSDQTNVGAQFVKGFGGLGGLLRYQVELPSISTVDESAGDDEDEYEEEDHKVSKDDFQLLTMIGKGAFGKVLQVRKKDTGEIFAMKVIRKSTVIERNQVAHTKAEKDILTKIEHPFVVRLHYAFQT